MIFFKNRLFHFHNNDNKAKIGKSKYAKSENTSQVGSDNDQV
jgi:hypothetical protein